MAAFVTSFAIFGAFVASTSFAVEAKCPMVMGKVPFDVTKFAGIWHLIGGSSDTNTIKGCGILNITVVPHRRGHDAVLEFTFDGETTGRHEGILQTVIGEHTGMMYSVQRRVGEVGYGGVFRQAVIASDYKSFAILISCRPEYDVGSASFGRILFAEVLSRTPSISSEKFDTLTGVLSSYGLGDQPNLRPGCASSVYVATT